PNAGPGSPSLIISPAHPSSSSFLMKRPVHPSSPPRIGSESTDAETTFADPAAQPLAWSDPGAHRHAAGCPIRLGGPRRTRAGALLHPRPEHRVESEVPAQDTVGAREDRESLPVHAARRPPR